MSQTKLSTVLYCVEEGIATITLHRPEKMNAFTAQMRDDLLLAFDMADADDAALRRCGIEARQTATGGGSDGNFTN